MPELPEVETVRTALETATVGKTISAVCTSGKRMRWPIPENIAALIQYGEITALRRRGKYVLMDIRDKQGQALVMLIHLGMSGSVRIYDSEKPEAAKHDHMILDLSDGARIVLNDPRRFGGVDIMPAENHAQHPLLARMGIEPLGNRLDGAFLKEALTGKTVSIKAALLDQRIIAGIGNIYASEACFLAGIHPGRKAGRISLKRCEALAEAIRDVLQAAIAAGGTSLRDHIQPGGDIGYFARALQVYGRSGEDCTECGSQIKEMRQTGRSTYYCPQCQH